MRRYGFTISEFDGIMNYLCREDMQKIWRKTSGQIIDVPFLAQMGGKDETEVCNRTDLPDAGCDSAWRLQTEDGSGQHIGLHPERRLGILGSI